MNLALRLSATATALAAALVWAAFGGRPDAQPMPAPSVHADRAVASPLSQPHEAAHARPHDPDLVVDAKLRALFDALLAAHPPTGSADADQAAMHHTLEQHFAGRAAERAKRLLRQYAHYQRAWSQAARDMPDTGGDAEATHALAATSARLRAQFFAPDEALGLFGGASTGAVRLAQSHGPATPTRLSEVADSVHTLRAQGAGDDEIYRVRASALSAQTADTLAAMDREQRAWDARLAAYRHERNALLESQAGASPDTLRASLQRLRDTRFAAEEQTRLAAYESDDGPQLQLP